MIAFIKGNTLKVNNGWSLTLRTDEQFDDGFITVQSNTKKPPSPYTYVSLTEAGRNFQMFTADTESSRFDRELGTWQHSIPLIELTQWTVTVKTPVIRFTQPLDSGLPLNYEKLKDMLDRILYIAFPELENNGISFTYTTELLSYLTTYPGFDYTIPEGNLFSAMTVIYNEFNGIPRLESIINGVYTFGVDLKNKENEIIELTEYDTIQISYTTREYATMGESRGLNVVNTNNNENDSSSLYTKDSIISIRSESTVIDESEMIHKMFYPISKKINVVFKEVGKSSNTVDITKYTVTSAEYDSLTSKGFTSGTTSKYKQNCIRYDINGLSLYGWGDVFKRTTPLSDVTVWQELIKSAQNNAGVTVDIPSSFELVGVNLNYKTILPQSLIRVAKENIDDINRYSTLQTNQGGSIVDLKKIGQVLHADIQSSGNEQTLYSVDVIESFDDIRNLNDYDTLTNSMITVVNIIGKEDNYSAQYSLSKDYQNRTDNIDISAGVREYPIPNDGKAIESVRYFEDYVEWNLEGIENNTSSFTSEGIEAFMKTFGKPSSLIKYSIDNVEYISSSAEDDFGNTARLIIPCESNGYRNTLWLYFAFNDSLFAYTKKLDDGAQIVNRGVLYTDSNGFADNLHLNFGKRYQTNQQLYIDQFPEADYFEYDTPTLIQIGDVTNQINTLEGTDRIYSDGGGPSSISRTENISVTINGAGGIPTDTIQILFDDEISAGTVSYSVLDVEITLLDIFGVSTNLGIYTIVPDVPVELNLKTLVDNGAIPNKHISQVTYFVTITGSKTISSGIYGYIISNEYKQLEIVLGDGYKFVKDSGEIPLFSYFAHNVFYKSTETDIGEIIIGDQTLLSNALVGGTLNDLSDLYVYESTRYNKYEKSIVKGNLVGSASTEITFPTSQSIKVNSISFGYSWALANGDGKLLFAVNPPRPINNTPQAVRKTVSLNFVHDRTGLER